MASYHHDRNAALRTMAQDAVDAYNTEFMRGMRPEYPLWAVHLIELLDEVEALVRPDGVVLH